MATGSQNMTTFNAKHIIGDSTNADWAGALLHSGRDGKTSSMDTWIFADDYGSASSTYGILHRQSDDKIIFIGASTNRFWNNLNSGDTYVAGKLGINYNPESSGNSYQLYVNGTSYLNGELSVIGTILEKNGSICIDNTTTDLTASNNGSSSTIYHSIWGRDKANRSWFCVEGYTNANGSVAAYLGVRNYNTSGTAQSWKGITITEAKDNTLTYTISDPDKFITAIMGDSDSSKFYRGDKTWASKLTGNLQIEKASDANVDVKCTDTSCSIQLDSYKDGRHGLWSNGYWDGSKFVSGASFLGYRNTSGANIWNGNATNVTGTVAIAHGGTDGTSANDAIKNLALGVTEASGDFTDSTVMITNNNDGTTNNWYRRAAVKMYNYIKNKASGTWGISISGNAETVSRATFGDSSHAEHNASNMTSNGLYYYTSNGPATSQGAKSTDGAMYVQAYNTAWVGQIAQDYRTGYLFVRSKNNNSWTSWLHVLNTDTGVSRYHVGSTASNSYILVTINPETSWMLNFTLKVYQGYVATDIQISGYNYGTNHWYSPQACILGSTSTGAIKVYFGYTANWKLWVAIDGGNYNGADVVDMCNGYTQIDPADAFTLTKVNSLPGTTQTTVTVYRPWYRDETVSNASYATTSGSCSGNAATATTAASCSGNAATATKATNDSDGNKISTTYAKIASHNNLTASGNEFTFASSGFSGGTWFNYRTAGGMNGNITEYIFGNGKGGSLASITSGTFNGNVSGSSSSCTGNAATATRINGNLTAATSDVVRNIWVSSTAGADGIPNYISGFYMNPSTKVFTVPAGTRISPSAGALYLGNSGNQNWVYVQDMASQASGTPWKLTQAGVLECADVRSANTRIVSNWIGFYQKANAGGNRYGYISCDVDRMYFRKENSSTQDHYFDFGSPLYVNGAIGCAGAITTASSLQTGSGITIRRDPSSGNCKIWFATNAAVNKWRIGVDGNDRFAISAYADGEGSYDFWVYNNGACYYKTSIGASSRYIKHNIHLLTMDTGNIIDRMEPVSFVFNNDQKETINLGFIYEDLVKILPEVCFHGEGEDNNLGINYTGIIPVLVKEIQSLRKRLATVETELNSYKSKT